MHTHSAGETTGIRTISPAAKAGQGRESVSLLVSRAWDWACPDSFARLGFTMLLYCVGAAASSNMLVRRVTIPDPIWLSNGLILAFLLTVKRRYWPSYLIASVAMNVLVHLYFGYSPGRSTLYSLGNTVEVLVAGSMLAEENGSRPDLTRFSTLLKFAFFAVLLGPAISTGLIEGVMGIWSYPHQFHMVPHWWLGDMMGMALMAPLLLAINRRGLEQIFAADKWLETVAILGSIAAAATAIFLWNGAVVAFLMIPLLLLAVVRLRSSGAALGVLLIAVPAVFTTARNHGVFLPTGAVIPHGYLVLQLFLVVSVVIVYAMNASLNARDRQPEMGAANYEDEAQAATDYGTGLANRMSFERHLNREWVSALHEQVELSILVVDVDHFNLYNEHYGHLAGDECLRRIAGILTNSSLRSSDMVARYGGEEFAIILPRASQQGAQAMAERIRQSVADAQVPHLTYTPGIVTVSVGVATMLPEPTVDPAHLVHCADLALHAAKRDGRNRVMVCEDCLQVLEPDAELKS